jgi:hypothetical protein
MHIQSQIRDEVEKQKAAMKEQGNEIENTHTSA